MKIKKYTDRDKQYIDRNKQYTDNDKYYNNKYRNLTNYNKTSNSLSEGDFISLKLSEFGGSPSDIAILTYSSKRNFLWKSIVSILSEKEFIKL